MRILDVLFLPVITCSKSVKLNESTLLNHTDTQHLPGGIRTVS